MRATLPSFDYYAPSSIEEVVDLLTRLEDAYLIAGGTDLIPGIRLKGIRPKSLVSLNKLRDELEFIKLENGNIKIGVLTRIADIVDSEYIKDNASCLHEAAKQIGSVQIRNRATIGGNLCNASPAADTALSLLVYDAKLKVVGIQGEREVDINDFFIGPGRTVLQRGEMLKEMSFPVKKGGQAFLKIGRRRGEDLAIVSVATFVSLENGVIKEVKIALGSVAPRPIRAIKAEKTIEGRSPKEDIIRTAGKIAMEEASPITDVRATAEYRRHLVEVLVRRALLKAVKGGI